MASLMHDPAAAAGEPVGKKVKSSKRTQYRRHQRRKLKQQAKALEQMEGGLAESSAQQRQQMYYDFFSDTEGEGVPFEVASEFVQAVIVADKEIENRKKKMWARQAQALHAFQRDEAKARAGILSDEGENRMLYKNLHEGLVKVQAKLECVRQPQASTCTGASVSFTLNRPAVPSDVPPQVAQANPFPRCLSDPGQLVGDTDGNDDALPHCPSTDPMPSYTKDAFDVLPCCPSTDKPLTTASGMEGADDELSWRPSTDPIRPTENTFEDDEEGEPLPWCPSTDPTGKKSNLSFSLPEAPGDEDEDEAGAEAPWKDLGCSGFPHCPSTDPLPTCDKEWGCLESGSGEETNGLSRTFSSASGDRPLSAHILASY